MINIVLPYWKRLDIFRICLKQLKIFTRAGNFHIVFVVSPEDDSDYERAIVESGLDYSVVYCENTYLGAKMNAGISKAVEIGCDYIMNMGSDDLLHPDLMKFYEPYMKARVDVFGLGSCYFMDLNRNVMYLEKSISPLIVGAGRMISYKAVKEIVGKGLGLYYKIAQRHLDWHSAQMLESFGYFENPIHAGDFPYIVDIKSEININSFDKIRTLARPADYQIIAQNYPHIFYNLN